MIRHTNIPVSFYVVSAATHHEHEMGDGGSDGWFFGNDVGDREAPIDDEAVE